MKGEGLDNRIIFFRQHAASIYGFVSFVSFVCQKKLLSKRPSSFCLIHFVGTSGAARGQKRTFDGRRPLMEDAL